MNKKLLRFDWNDLHYFSVLAQMKSLSATARHLDVTHATVSRHLTRLESALDAQLFDRTPEGYALNEIGEQILQKTMQMQELAELVPFAASAPTGPSGTIKITSVPSIFEYWLSPLMSEFCMLYHNIDLDVLVDSRNVSLSRGEAHIALRLAMPERGDLITRKLASIQYCVCGTADQVAKTEAGEQVSLIGFRFGSQNIPEAVWLEDNIAGRQVILRSNSVSVQVSAAKTGMGLAVLPRFIIEKIPELCTTELLGPPPSREMWLLMRPDMAKKPRIRAFVDFVSGCVQNSGSGF